MLRPTGKTAIIVDDGIATGLTMKAAIGEIVRHRQRRVIVAVPVAPSEVAAELSPLVEKFVTIINDPPGVFRGSIGAYYHSFSQLTDEDVISALRPTFLS